MRSMRRIFSVFLAMGLMIGIAARARGGDGGAPAPACAPASDALASWNEGATKAAIVQFVADVTTEGKPGFVPVAERIAVLDNDGTLWSEQPMYVQLAFALDRVRALAPEHPEWKTTEPFRSVLEGNVPGLMATGEHGLMQVVMATHAGMTTDEFDKIVLDWLATAKHPKYGHLYTECVYVPMLELLAYLRANGFKTYIVSGGGVDFVRPFTMKAYGIPPEQVVGSTLKTKYEERDGKPVLLRLPEIGQIDDKAGKPMCIHQFIGRRPTAAFGNSDGDYEMLDWTTSAPGRRFGLIVQHTDDVREVAYDRKSFIGRLDKGLDAAVAKGWVVVDMKKDWKRVFAFDK